MGLLDRFEQSMERLLEGTTGSLFRQSLQPADLGKRLQKSMLAQQRPSVGGPAAPNVYVIRLHPRDYAQFETFQVSLCRQMESHLAQIAGRQGISFFDRVSVSLEADDSARPRQPVVDAAFTDSARAHPPPQRPQRARGASPRPDATSAFHVPHRPSRGASFSLVGADGTAFPVPEGSSTIGRSPDNTIVLDAPDVSRRHAHIERTGYHVRIFDMNSTNGTRVNGEAVHISDLEPGDTVRIGGQELTLSGGDSSSRRPGRW